MNETALRNAIETALGSVPFEPPVSHEYCAAVRDALRPALPSATLDVFHRGKDASLELVVQARDGAAYCELVLPLG